MLEHLLPIFLSHDSRLRRLGETIFKFILTITIAIGTWTALVDARFNFMFSDLQNTVKFLFSPSFLFLAVLFILYWYLFYSLIPLITFVFFLRIATKAHSTKPKPNNPKPPSKVAARIIDALAWAGILTRGGMTIGIIPLTPSIMSRIKESLTQDKAGSLSTEITSPYVVFEFAVVYLFYIAPSLHVPVIFTVGVIIFAILLFLSGLLVEFFARFLRLFPEQITQWLDESKNVEVKNDSRNRLKYFLS